MTLYTGNSATYREEKAFAFAHSLGLTKDHPDLHLIRPEGKFHSLDAIRAFSEEVFLPPYSASCKLFILFDAEKMQPTGSNALLKTLEEPTLDTHILLLARSAHDLLPTIVSRCQVHYFPSSYKEEAFPLADELVELLTQEMPYHERLLKIKRVAEGADQRIFIAVLAWYRDLWAAKTGAKPDQFFYPKLKSVKQKEIASLMEVQKKVGEALFLLERSFPIATILENLLLKLV